MNWNGEADGARRTSVVPAPAVTLRAAQPADQEFLLSVYASTRAEELTRVDWTADAKTQFLRQQFQAQDHAYRNNYPGAEYSIIVIDGADAGRLCLHRRTNEIRIMDIALLPPHRRRGIGTRLLREVLAEGAATGKIVSIHVEVFNPAQRLYERLGFHAAGLNGVYQLLEWQPPPRKSAV